MRGLGEKKVSKQGSLQSLKEARAFDLYFMENHILYRIFMVPPRNFLGSKI